MDTLLKARNLITFTKIKIEDELRVLRDELIKSGFDAIEVNIETIDFSNQADEIVHQVFTVNINTKLKS